MAATWRKNYVRYSNMFLNNVAKYQKRQDVKAYLELVLSLVTITIFAAFALRPTLLTIASLLKEIKAKEEVIVSLDTKIENIKRAQQLLNQEKESIALLKTAIPPGPQPDTFIRQLEGISESSVSNVSSLSISKITILGASNTKNKKSEIASIAEEMPFGITTNSNYQSLVDFLTQLESLRRPLLIDQITLRSTTKEEVSLLNMNISGQAPFFRLNGDIDN